MYVALWAALWSCGLLSELTEHTPDGPWSSVKPLSQLSDLLLRFEVLVYIPKKNPGLLRQSQFGSKNAISWKNGRNLLNLVNSFILWDTA